MGIYSALLSVLCLALGFLLLSLIAFYTIIKKAVKNGIIEAVSELKENDEQNFD